MLEKIGLRIASALNGSIEREEGQTLVEYALILATISIGVLVVMGLLRDEIGQVFSNIITGLS